MKTIKKFSPIFIGSILLMLAVALPATPAAAGVLGPSPQGKILANNPDFGWVALDGAEYYKLEVTVNGQIVIDEWRTTSALDCAGFNYCQFANDANLAVDVVGDHAGSWRWRPYNSTDGVGAWSSTYSFTIQAPEIFEITTPDPSSPNYKVERITNESSFDAPDLYRMFVRPVGSTNTVLDLWTPPVTCTNDITFGEVCILYPYQQPELPNGDYRFWVQAFSFGQGFSAWSPGFEFSVSGNPPAPGLNFGATSVLQYTDQSNTCPADGDGTGVLCASTTLWPVVDYQFGEIDWIQIEISEEGGPVVFSQWVTADGTSPYCLESGDFPGVGVCTFAVPFVFEYGEAYTWRTRVYDDIKGISAWTVPGGTGDEADVSRIEVVFPL